MKTLSKEQILSLHAQLIDRAGGTHGMRDENLLESALAAPFQYYGDTPAYPSVRKKAARLAYGLIKNHPMLDGNKRLGAHAMLVLLSINGIELQYTQKEFSDLILWIAAGGLTYDDLLLWILDHDT